MHEIPDGNLEEGIVEDSHYVIPLGLVTFKGQIWGVQAFVEEVTLGEIGVQIHFDKWTGRDPTIDFGVDDESGDDPYEHEPAYGVIVNLEDEIWGEDGRPQTPAEQLDLVLPWLELIDRDEMLEILESLAHEPGDHEEE